MVSALPFLIEKLDKIHMAEGFDCGVETMTQWLKRYALMSRQSDLTQTYVLHARNAHIIGYYALSAGEVNRDSAPERIAKGIPNYPVSVIVLTRLAVDKRFHGKGLGAALLRDALIRIERAADIIGIRAVLVHAISEEAREFYLHHGFLPSPLDPLHLMLLLKDLRATLRAAKEG